MTKARTSFYILIPLLSCVVAVLLVETALALFYPIPFSLEKNMYFEPDPYTGFRNKPLSRGYYPNGMEANANSRGHRDTEVAVPKPEGVFRILVIGDSFTVGSNVEQADAYPQVIERLLNERGANVEVVNAGTGGWSPFQYAQYYEHYGRELDPDLVVVGFFVGNDVYIDRDEVNATRTAVMGRRMARNVGQGIGIKARILLYENSHIVRAIMSPGAPSGDDFIRDRCDEFTEFYLAVQQQRLAGQTAVPSAEELDYLQGNAAQIIRMRDMATADGIPLVAAVFPDEIQLNPALQQVLLTGKNPSDYDFAMPQPLVKERFDAAGVDYIDLLEPIANDPRCLYMNETHWAPAGHDFVARQLIDYLDQLELLP